MKKFFKRGLSSEARDQIDGLLFVALPIIGSSFFVGIPLIFSLVLSFGKLTTFEITDITFLGFENYARIFLEDKIFWASVGWSFLFAVSSSLLQTIFSLSHLILIIYYFIFFFNIIKKFAEIFPNLFKYLFYMAELVN